MTTATSNRPRTLIATLAASTVGLLAIGCGDSSGLPSRYAVSGDVTYNNEPVPQGTIVFIPPNTETGHVAQGTIEDGHYVLSTTGDGGDGALPGDYKVIIMAKKVDMSGVEANRGGGAGRQDDVFKAEKAAERLIPQKYEQAETSGLNAKVEEKSNDIDFTLTD